jgi:hypothetical protein
VSIHFLRSDILVLKSLLRRSSDSLPSLESVDDSEDLTQPPPYSNLPITEFAIPLGTIPYFRTRNTMTVDITEPVVQLLSERLARLMHQIPPTEYQRRVINFQQWRRQNHRVELSLVSLFISLFPFLSFSKFPTFLGQALGLSSLVPHSRMFNLPHPLSSIDRELWCVLHA